VSPADKKRRSAVHAKPVVHKGVKYEAVLWTEPTWGSDPLPDTATAFVFAMKADDGSELWRAKLYDVRFDPDMERDKQEVYVEKLSLNLFGTKLKAVDEKGRKYAIDLESHAVEAL
jgi:hypothetical protein